MSGTNGNGEDEFGDDTTPNERPEATLAFHKPYVFALSNLCSELSRTNHILAAMLHDIRVAKESIAAEALHGIGKALSELGQTFAIHAAEFSK